MCRGLSGSGVDCGYEFGVTGADLHLWAHLEHLECLEVDLVDLSHHHHPPQNLASLLSQEVVEANLQARG